MQRRRVLCGFRPGGTTTPYANATNFNRQYVNHYDRHAKTPDEYPTFGMLLCKRKKDALIELTLPKNANIFASQYELYLPSKDDPHDRLMQWSAEEEGRA